MEDLFTVIKAEDIEDNLFKLIGKDWMLICAGTPMHYNMMTASWGCAGVLWSKPVAIAFIRPQRHTFLFVEESPYFTLNFFDEKHKDVLNLCGTVSGKDMNKMDVPGLDPLQTPTGNVIFQQAKLVLECRKIYHDDIKPEFFQAFNIEKIYSKKDYHRMYVGEISSVWMRK